MDLQTEKGTKRAVCFNKHRYPLFEEVNESASTALVIKKAKLDNEDILITDYSRIEKLEEAKLVVMNEQKITPISMAFAECSLYERINIIAKLSNISPITDREKEDGSKVLVQTAVAHDKSGSGNITIFADCVDKVVQDKIYKFTHITVGRFKGERLLKTTDVTQIEEAADADDIVINDKTATVKSIDKFPCKFISVDISSLQKKVMCPKCKNSVQLDDDVAVCENCQMVSAIEECTHKSIVQCQLLAIKTSKKYDSMVAANILEKCIGFPIEKSIAFIKKSMKLKFLCETDIRDNEILSLEIIEDMDI